MVDTTIWSPLQRSYLLRSLSVSVTQLGVEVITKPASAWSLLSKSYIDTSNQAHLGTKQSQCLVNTSCPIDWPGPSQLP